jgi:hypothetical protein
MVMPRRDFAIAHAVTNGLHHAPFRGRQKIGMGRAASLCHSTSLARARRNYSTQTRGREAPSASPQPLAREADKQKLLRSFCRLDAAFA